MGDISSTTEQLSVKLFFRAALRLAALAAVLGAAAVITFGYLGWLHPAFDSFSHFRIHAAIVLGLSAVPLLLFRFVPEAVFALLLATTAILQTTGLPFVAGPGVASADGSGTATPTYRLLQLNLRYDNPEPERALSLIGELRPDIVTLNEVSSMWAEKLKLLKAAYPYQLICPPPAYVGGSAILSRRPFVEGFESHCADRGSYGHARIDLGGAEVDIGALHLGWPWPFEQPWQLPHLEPTLSDLGETAILAGDFNAVPWSHTTRRVADASETRILRGIGPSWLSYRLPEAVRPWIGLPIDQVLVKGGVVPVGLKALPSAGSDHLPVLLEFMVLPPEKPAGVLHARVASSE